MSHDAQNPIFVLSPSTPEHRGRRTRTGCWTCRKRKKKCSGSTFPCQNCIRLGLGCDTSTRLVWEEDTRREGISRRGPSKAPKKQCSVTKIDSAVVNHKHGLHTPEIYPGRVSQNESATHEMAGSIPQSTTIQCQIVGHINPLPTVLTNNEYILLDHYIQRFSRTYPTCSEPANPFLSILLPLAMENSVVLDALLALSGTQSWNERAWSMEKTTLGLRHRALKGCQRQLARFQLQTAVRPDVKRDLLINDTNMNDLVFPLATCILLLLYEKLVGDGKANWMPHLEFLAKVFGHSSFLTNEMMSGLNVPQSLEAVRFFHNLFLYNDLVHSTARGAPTLSAFYLQLGRHTSMSSDNPADECGSWMSPHMKEALQDERFYYPYLVAQISAGNEDINDTDIMSWDGRMDWFPSFSLATTPFLPPDSLATTAFPRTPLAEIYNNPITSSIDDQEKSLISNIYRTSARVYLIQASRQRYNLFPETKSTFDPSYLAAEAIYQISQLRDGSVFETTLLWPISIVSRELSSSYVIEREYLLNRLQAVEKRLNMKCFARMQEVLTCRWIRRDRGLTFEGANTEDTFLFG